MPNNPKSIILRAHEVQGLIAAGEVLVVRPIKNIPPDADGPYEYAMAPGSGSMTGVFSFKVNGKRVIVKSPFGPTRTQLIVKERWNVNGLAWGQHHKSALVKSAAKKAFHFESTDTGEWKPYWGNWRSPQTMPLDRAQFTVSPQSIRCGQIQSVTEEEAVAAGMQFNPKAKPNPWSPDWSKERTTKEFPFLHQHGFMTAQEALGNVFNKTAKPGARWADNPWCWFALLKRFNPA